jgi:metal-responsive CopG/Arc/MetJ family transcriptional regulator
VSVAKIAITLERDMLERLDKLVAAGRFPSRSRAIQLAVEAQIERVEKRRLAQECLKLDPGAEQALAEEGASYDLEGWPEY